MANLLIYHIASGQAFFTGIALIYIAVGLAARLRERHSPFWVTILGFAGSAFILVSATPLSLGFYGFAGSVTLGWILLENYFRTRYAKARWWLRILVVAGWGCGLAWELPYHIMPTLPATSAKTLDVVGDSLTAGMGNSVETWPKILARSHNLQVRSHAVAGATAASAYSQALELTRTDTLVLVEIGGNDVLGETTAQTFERSLNTLLTKLRSGDRTVVMFELPLPPLSHRFGTIQRRLAQRHHVVLVPKRFLLKILTTPGATVDSVHLSQKGQTLLAQSVGELIAPTLGRPHE